MERGVGRQDLEFCLSQHNTCKAKWRGLWLLSEEPQSSSDTGFHERAHPLFLQQVVIEGLLDDVLSRRGSDLRNREILPPGNRQSGTKGKGNVPNGDKGRF